MARGRPLVLQEREEISRGIARGDTGRLIAERMGRSPSVVTREIARNGGRDAYRAVDAQARADAEMARPQERKLEASPALLEEVNTMAAVKWSPEQIAVKLAGKYPDDPSMTVSHETIYKALYVQARGGLKAELRVEIRSGRTKRVSRSGRRRLAEAKQQVIPNMVMITERPAEAEDRAVPGHWEGDLIMGAGNRSAIATLVERTTRYAILVRLPYDHTAPRVSRLLAQGMNRLPEDLKKSLTWDQGREMAKHEHFTELTAIPVYFCDPHSPWQRGTNENTNGLLRQYFPKGTDLSDYSQAHLDAVADELNHRPRQTLGWASPYEKLSAILGEAHDAFTS